MTAAETVAVARDGKGCLGRSEVDEPVFVLVARDRFAPQAVRDWAEAVAMAKGGVDDKVAEALRVADDMEAWQAAHGGGKVPD